MKMGISVWSFREGTSLKDLFLTAKKAGFDGVEVALEETGELGLDSSQNDIKAILKTARECGVALYSVASGLYWKYSLTSGDKSIREKARGIVRKQLEAANLLGCDTILVVPGCVGADFIPGCEVVAYDDAYDRALDALGELKIDAQRLGVSIGVENVFNKFLLSPLEMRDFIDKLGSPFVGAYLDVGNVLYSGYPEHWIRILGKRIKKVHFKDYRINTAALTGFVDLLSGDVNYPEVMKAFHEAGYDGWVTAEMGAYHHFGDQLIYNTANAMKRILEG